MNKRKTKNGARKPRSVEAPESSVEKVHAATSNPTGNGAYPDLECDAWVLHEDALPNAADRHPFDLAERTALFGESIIHFAKKIPRGPGNDRVVDQLVGAGTSVGANYCEANESCSKRDFLHSISRCSKEAHETKHFLRMAASTEPKLVAEARRLYREANELHLIFASIFRKGGGRKR
jgi:four helix bundle protein